ncbi:MAG: hypothetical protein ABIO92_08290 [Chloroflexia bacterium]
MKWLVSRLINVGIFGGLAITGLLVVAAYQVRPTYDIVIGSATDAPLLRGFNTKEVIPATPPIPFRWSTAESEIILQDVGRQDLDVTLTLNGWRLPGQPPSQLEISSRGRTLLAKNPAAEFTDYSFRVPRELLDQGTLRLELRTNAFIPPEDPNPRPLGVSVSRVRVAPATNPDRFIESPVGVMFALVGTSVLIGLVLALLGWGVGAVALGSALPGILGTALLVFDRLWLTSGRWYEIWPQAVLAGAFLVLSLRLVAWLLRRRVQGGWLIVGDKILMTLLLAAFVIRLAGQLHPQIFIVDLVFHAHRFETVQAGDLLFTINSAEWGGRPTFYLPTLYVFMLPLQWLLNDQLLVIRLFTVALSSLGILPLYYLVRKTTQSRRASLIGSALYLTFPIAVLPFSWGITSNLFGEFFALCALAVAAGTYTKLGLRGPHLYILLACLLLALLSHPGVVQLTAAAFFLVGMLWIVARRLVPRRVGAYLTLAALVVAAGVSYTIYYNHFAAEMIETYSVIRAERAAEAGASGFHIKVGGSVGDKSLGLIVRTVESRREWLLGGLRGIWQEAHAYYRVWPLLGAFLGYALLLRGRVKILTKGTEPGQRLALAALGWSMAVLLFALVGWALNLYVRYMLFALPIIAIGAGIWLARLGQTSRAATLLSALLVVFFVVEALALWQYRITYAFK